MSDVLTIEQRRKCMSRIRGRDTKPEMILRKALWANGFRYRLRYPLTGRPDLVFPGKRLAVFVDGCFWHGCPEHQVMPRNNREFWEEKLGKNRLRDRKVNQELKEAGWRVLRFWEHEVRKDPEDCVRRVRDALSAHAGSRQKELINSA